MKILIACELSGIVRDAFSKNGHNAYSCDILDTESKLTMQEGKHIKGDVLKYLNEGWDLMIAFPPCTHLAISGTRSFPEKIADGRQQQAIDFFMQMINAPINRIAVENPIGIMSTEYRKPDQIIHPYYFGDTAKKSTCLWLKNLPLLFHAKQRDLFNDVITHVEDGGYKYWNDGKTGKLKRQPKWYYDAACIGNLELRSKIRSQTFPGIANAMANQWNIL